MASFVEYLIRNMEERYFRASLPEFEEGLDFAAKIVYHAPDIKIGMIVEGGNVGIGAADPDYGPIEGCRIRVFLPKKVVLQLTDESGLAEFGSQDKFPNNCEFGIRIWWLPHEQRCK
jgi:hypothetical protein